MIEAVALAYTRRVYDAAFAWYGNADTKAQVILTLDGAFLAFLTSAVFMDPTALAAILARFNVLTWLLLVLMCATLAASILSAVACLHSRLDSEMAIDAMLRSAGVDPARADTYAPQAMYFFQPISRLDATQLAKALSAVDTDFEIRALAHETRALSTNVRTKHRWINRGFAFAAASLLLFLAVSVSYVARIAP